MRPDSRPLQVYLDSSDFSRFGDFLEGKGRPEIGALLTSLEALVASKAIECRFSYIHVVEAAPTTEVALHHARGRARAIERLCGRKALAPFTELPAIDASGILKGDSLGTFPRDRSRFHGRSDIGQWFPSFDSTMVEIAEMMTALSNDVLGAVKESDPEFAANRAMRRKLKKKAKPAKVSKSIREMMPSAWPQFEAKIRTQFPLTKESSSTWQRFILRKADLSEVSTAIASDLSDLPEIMNWMSPTATGHLREAASWLRSSTYQFSDLIAASLEKMRELQERNSTIIDESQRRALWEQGKVERRRKFEQQLLDSALKSIEKDRETLQLQGVDPKELYDLVQEKGLDVLPSQRTLVAVWAANFEKNISPFEAKRKAEKVASDVGDIMHACYMPYVDIMRVDGFAYQYMLNAANSAQTILVDKLERLVPTIHSLISDDPC